ncbi:MAG: FliA/WhiG family RNA polymerase sigma factor [Deltaproteobacteria bacterium]|nr:FliA/WhiG family RNA polymerase sigma factor [Deltaproteobacteria bacterium]
MDRWDDGCSMTYQEYTKTSLRLDEEQKTIVVEYMPLVKFIAQRIKDRLPGHIQIEDLEHAGVLGLMEAVCRYDETQSNQFKTYAEHRIRGSILDDLRKNDWMTRTGREKYKLLESTISKLEKEHNREVSSDEIAKALGMKMDDYFDFLNDAKTGVFLSLEDVVSRRDMGGQQLDDQMSEPEKKVWIDQVKKLMAEEIENLSKTQRLVLSLYYYDELTLKEIGEVLNKTESRICQIHNEIMEKLARRLRKRVQYV